MRMEILIDAAEFWPRLEADIHGARDRVLLQTLSFEGDKAGHGVADAMLASQATDRRIIADEFYTRHRVNDHYLHNPKHWGRKDLRAERDATLGMMDRLRSNGVDVKLANPSSPMTLNFIWRNHKKIAVIDETAGYIGGINFSDHNFEWHDMMLRIECPEVAKFLAGDFEETWHGRDQNTSRKFDGIEIFTFDGCNNRVDFKPLMELIANAKKSVTILSPYITYPFFEPVRRAQENGAKVVLIAPDNNNWGVLWEYLVWETTKWRIDLMLYDGTMSHLKAMLIDDEHLVLGSSNFDFLSYCHMQEIVGVVTDPGVIADFKKRVIEPDLARAHLSRERVPEWRGIYHIARLKTLSAIFQGVAKIFRPGR